MRVITKEKLLKYIFAELQAVAGNRGFLHWGNADQWCIHGSDLKQAIERMFADNNIFKPTIDVDAVKIRCENCKHFERRSYPYSTHDGWCNNNEFECSHDEPCLFEPKEDWKG